MALVIAATAGGASGAPAPLSVAVHARSLAPGELARVLVESPEPLASVSGTLHGEPLEFVQASSHARGRTWSSWVGLDLAWNAGSVAVEVQGRSAGGSVRRGATSFELVSKEFPESRLSVEPRFVNPPKTVQARIAREQARLARVYAERAKVEPPAAPFVRPVEGEPTSVFGARRIFNGEPRAPHPGLDLHAASGTPVQCSGPGRVALAQDLYYSGNTVIVDHGGGLFTVYAHLSRIDVREGQRVAAGTGVGLSGATGRVTGPHLHWGCKVRGRIVDPTSILEPSLYAVP